MSFELFSTESFSEAKIKAKQKSRGLSKERANVEKKSDPVSHRLH